MSAVILSGCCRTQEYNTEAAFAAAVLLSTLALLTLFIKDKVEAAAASEVRK
jgi:sulfate transport system permease protein